jgi:hypothetical protein
MTESHSQLSEKLSRRPDLALYVDHIAIVLGEEKRNINQRNPAELQQSEIIGINDPNIKSIPTSVIGKLPCLFAYTACGGHVELFCYERTTKKKYPLGSYDLDPARAGTMAYSNRAKLAISMMNVSRIGHHWIKLGLTEWSFGSKPYYVEMLPRPGGALLTHFPRGVIKRYLLSTVNLNDDHAKRIFNMYDYLKKKPHDNAIRCINLTAPKKLLTDRGNRRRNADTTSCIVITLAPYLADVKFKADEIKKVMQSLKCVAEMLVVLHNDNRVHG